MRVFTFLLMMMVATVGAMTGYRLITGKDLVNLADFGVGSQTNSASVVAGAPTPTAASQPNPTPKPTPSPSPVRTPTTETSKMMVVGNTDGQGVYLRQTPRMEDKLQAWRDGTRMEVIGGPVEGDGRKWMRVRAPNGTEGYIPVEYVVELP